MLGEDCTALRKAVLVDVRVILALTMAHATKHMMDIGATAGGPHLRDQFVQTVSKKDISNAKGS